MKITIALYSENLSWDKKWIYLGKSYLKLKSVEKKISGSRIKINKFLHQVYEKELKSYLEWIENQRIKSNDSFYWWMSTLGSRNNADSILFLYLCQILSLDKVLDDSKEDEILVVCEDIVLIQTIIKNLKKHNFKKNNSLKIKIFKHLMFDYLKILKNTVIAILDLLVNFICSKITLKEKNFPEKDIYLIHQFMSSDTLKNEKLKSRYFPYLKEFLEKENKNLYCLTWSRPFWLGKIKAFKTLRNEKHLIPEDWISFYDYIFMIKNFFKCTKYFNPQILYRELDLSFLILNERRDYLKKISSILRFWSYTPAIKKWSKNCNSLTCIDHYENMIYEHALIGAIRQTKKKIRILGYHHTLASKEFIPWHSLKTEWNSASKPDYVISLGTVSNKMLTDQGVPNEKIINGPALRYNKILLKNNENLMKKNNILITLPPYVDESIELMSNVLILSKYLENTNFKIIIKSHPNLDISKILSILNLRKFPKNLTFSNDSLEENLNLSLFVISMSTGAVYDAAINGNIIFNLESELQLASNYLDIFENDFSLLQSNSIHEIKNSLLSLDKDDQKLQFYKNDFNRLRDYLTKGMNPVNDLHLAQFKLN